MTKTKGKVAKTQTTTPDGRDGYRIECTCTTHPQGMSAAVVGFEIGNDRIHGTVLMAHHPANIFQKTNAAKRIWKA